MWFKPLGIADLNKLDMTKGCPACESRAVSTTYVSMLEGGLRRAYEIGDRTVRIHCGDAHMRRECDACGYAWPEQCLNYEPPGPLPIALADLCAVLSAANVMCAGIPIVPRIRAKAPRLREERACLRNQVFWRKTCEEFCDKYELEA